MRARLPAVLLVLWLLPAIGHSEVGDFTLETNHPDYPGEGLLQTPAGCVRHATAAGGTEQEQALALFNWLLTHQWHLHSPQEWNVPGRTPGERPDDPEMIVYDANRGRFSYGYGLCGTVHAWNEVYWRALGHEARRRAFPGHTNSEVRLGDRWCMMDTDMAGIVFLPDGRLAGYDDIAGDLSLLTRPQAPWPRYPFAWPSDFQAMQRGWAEIARGDHWYKLYHGGYAAHPGVVHLRSGETFTRYYGPDGFGGEEQRRFWHRLPGGPNRHWTFANQGTPHHDGAKSNSRGRMTYGNALFDYRPDLTRDRCRESWAESSDNLSITPGGLRSSTAETATAVVEHFSPYVICGDPVDNENPLTGTATGGWIVSGQSRGPVTLELSVDQGQSWQPGETVEGEFRLDFTEQAKGRYGWLLRVTLPAGSTLETLRTITTCQMSQALYPRLRPNGTTVIGRAGGRAVVPVLPRLEEEASTTERFERRDLRPANIQFVGRSPTQRQAYRVLGPRAASVVFRIPSRTPLAALSAAARYSVRSPSPEGAEYKLDYSIDDGQTWQPLGHSAPPTDNEYSSGWVYGAAELPAPADSEVLVRVSLYGGGVATSLMTAELYGLRTTRNNSAATVTYHWHEGEAARSHTFTVPAGQERFEATIPTGEQVRDHAVVVSVE